MTEAKLTGAIGEGVATTRVLALDTREVVMPAKGRTRRSFPSSTRATGTRNSARISARNSPAERLVTRAEYHTFARQVGTPSKA
jgi:hypothetical protein